MNVSLTGKKHNVSSYETYIFKPGGSLGVFTPAYLGSHALYGVVKPSHDDGGRPGKSRCGFWQNSGFHIPNPLSFDIV
jgi:hypothetical protein